MKSSAVVKPRQPRRQIDPGEATLQASVDLYLSLQDLYLSLQAVLTCIAHCR